MDRLMRRNNTDPSYSSKSPSRRSDESYGSHSTTPSSVYDSPRPSPRPSLQHAATAEYRNRHVTYSTDASPVTSLHARSSTSTYALTIPSTDNFDEEPEEYDDIRDEEPEERQYFPTFDARASTYRDFADFFPSHRRLAIRHDDTTEDGNMNLRIDTKVTEGGHKTQVQLFHLRMHDLKARHFSLRRYCRDSGREVCHSSRKYTKPANERPGIQRSMSNALATLRIKPEFKRTKSAGSFKSSLKRQDSGYGSNDDEDFEDDDEISSFMSTSTSSKTSHLSIPTNTTKLEFSNYIQVDVRRRGAKKHKRYQFEYWGSNYSWKRVSNKDSAGKSISYHLIKNGTGVPIAHIVPELRSSEQIRAEEEAGGWVPPCSMWISDENILSNSTDVADIIVATGLIALVDDCIKRHFGPQKPQTKHKRQISVPLTPLKMEYVGPKALVEHVFRRRTSSERDRDGEKEREGHGAHAYAHAQSPLRTAVTAY